MRKHLPAYLMCAPTMVLFLVFMVFPIAFVFYSSLLNWDGIGSIRDAKWIGLENYRRLVGDAYWWTAVRNTLLYALLKLVVELPLALIVALVLNSKLLGKTFFRTVGFLPVVTSIAVVSLTFTFFFSPLGGPFNTLLLQLGILERPIAFLGERQYALWTVTSVAIWHDLGINMVFFLAALQTVPRDLYEAADLDGAGVWEKFRSITVPSIRPITAVIVMLSLAGSLKVFDYFAVMTGGGPGLRLDHHGPLHVPLHLVRRRRAGRQPDDPGGRLRLNHRHRARAGHLRRHPPPAVAQPPPGRRVMGDG